MYSRWWWWSMMIEEKVMEEDLKKAMMRMEMGKNKLVGLLELVEVDRAASLAQWSVSWLLGRARVRFPQTVEEIVVPSSSVFEVANTGIAFNAEGRFSGPSR